MQYILNYGKPLAGHAKEQIENKISDRLTEVFVSGQINLNEEIAPQANQILKTSINAMIQIQAFGIPDLLVLPADPLLAAFVSGMFWHNTECKIVLLDASGEFVTLID